MANLVAFPQQATSSSENASRLDILRGRLTEYIGSIFAALRVPGFIAPTSISDSCSGQRIEIKVGAIFTRISVNGRDYYFNRLSGKFDGTGMGCS